MRRPIAAATAVLATVAVIGFAPGTATAAPSDVFFSEYIEGSSNNKALEIFNGTGAADRPGRRRLPGRRWLQRQPDRRR